MRMDVFLIYLKIYDELFHLGIKGEKGNGIFITIYFRRCGK